MGAMGGMGGGVGGGGGTRRKYDDTIFYVKPAVRTRTSTRSSRSSMTVLIDQDRVQDFLVELENSPMSIQVMDFELAAAACAVTKPEKGEHARRHG